MDEEATRNPQCRAGLEDLATGTQAAREGSCLHTLARQSSTSPAVRAAVLVEKRILDEIDIASTKDVRGGSRDVGEFDIEAALQIQMLTGAP